MSGQPLEDGNRRAMRSDHRSAGNDERLLEGVLAFENGVAHAIGKDNPTGIWRELPATFGRIFLKARVLFHGVVTAVHEMVVGRTSCAGKTQSPRYRAKRIRARGFRKPEGSRESRRNAFERFGGQPNAVLRRIDVREETQDAIAVGGTRGKRIDVAEVVARVQAGSAAPLFDGSVAGVIEFPLVRVRRKELGEEFSGRLRIGAEDFAELLALGGFRFVEAGDAIFGGTVRDILVIRGASLLLAKERLAVSCGDLEWSARKEKNIAGFQLRAEPVSAVGAR